MLRLFAYIARNRLKWLGLVLILGITLDQASKIWAQYYLAEPYEAFEEVVVNGKTETIKREVFYPVRIVQVIPNAFNFIYKENPAAAFSLTSSLPSWIRKPLLVSISILATLFFLLWYFRLKGDGMLLASFSFILAGAFGNLSDRLRLGYVIDFLDVHAGFLGYPYSHWPTFNVADALIVIGAFGVIFRTFRPLK